MIIYSGLCGHSPGKGKRFSLMPDLYFLNDISLATLNI